MPLTSSAAVPYALRALDRCLPPDLPAGAAAGGERGSAAARRQAHQRLGPPARLRRPDRLVRHRGRRVLRADRSRRRAEPPARPAPVHLGAGRRLPRRRQRPARPAVDRVRAADHRRRLADPHLLDRLHGARPRPAAVLRRAQPVRRRDAAARPRRQLPAALRRLGGRRSRVVPADRLLVAQAERRGRGEEGVPRQPGR